MARRTPGVDMLLRLKANDSKELVSDNPAYRARGLRIGNCSTIPFIREQSGQGTIGQSQMKTRVQTALEPMIFEILPGRRRRRVQQN